MILRNFIVATMMLLSFTACDDSESTPEPVIKETETFAKGADVSWVTEMEKSGVKFYNTKGRETECMALMQETGMNSIRLRVWVNPTNGWCNKSDLLVKAIRANNLGMRLMIDFHYSDVWADPGSQTKPTAWNSLSFDELKAAVATHTNEVLSLLKKHNITPEWVQVGNETGNGMLWEEGKASEHMAQYAALNNAGYDAVKAVFPDAKVIIHLQGGQDNSLYQWMFNGLKTNGAKWDVIGMSLYPEVENWQDYNDKCIANIKDMISRYNCEVMICEVGMQWDKAATGKLFLTDLITRAKAIENERCLGVFYWEPQSYNSWNGYSKGAFDANGQPTEALDAFK